MFFFSLLVFTHSKLCCDSPSIIQFLPSMSLYPRSHLRHNLLCPTSAQRFFPSLSHLRQSHLRHNLLRPASFSRGLPPNIEGSPSFPIVSRSLSTPGVVYPWRCLQLSRDGPLGSVGPTLSLDDSDLWRGECCSQNFVSNGCCLFLS